jgi:hypothetical protein
MPTLEITTKLGFSLACRFCPQDRLVKSYPRGESRELSLDEFRLVVGKLPPHVRVDFSGMAEPWLNPHATAMVVHAFEHGRKVAIYTTLQGMPANDAAMLIERFSDRIAWETPWVIHLPDRHGNMTGWKPSAAYQATLARFVALRRERAPPGLMFMTMSPDGEPADALRPMLDERLDGFVGISRVENLDRSEFSPGELLRQVRHERAVRLDAVLRPQRHAAERRRRAVLHGLFASARAGKPVSPKLRRALRRRRDGGSPRAGNDDRRWRADLPALS